MGGATQSKLAFINSTLKKKSEDLNKTKNAAEETKTQVTDEKVENGNVENSETMANIDLNEKTEEKKAEEDLKGEEKKDTEVEKKETTEVEKKDTEVEKKETTEGEKKSAKKSNTKEKIMQSFRFTKKSKTCKTEKSDRTEETKNTAEEIAVDSNKVEEKVQLSKDSEKVDLAKDSTEVEPNNDLMAPKMEPSPEATEVNENPDEPKHDVTDATTAELKPEEDSSKKPKRSAKDKIMSSFRFLKKKPAKTEEAKVEAEETAEEDEPKPETPVEPEIKPETTAEAVATSEKVEVDEVVVTEEKVEPSCSVAEAKVVAEVVPEEVPVEQSQGKNDQKE